MPLVLGPKCGWPGCTKSCHPQGKTRDINGNPKQQKDVKWKKWCYKHHNHITKENNGGKNITLATAINAGYSTEEEYWNTKGNRPYKKDYCENIDGRLNFKCTTTILGVARELELDHINGNPFDDRPSNFQTLCASCHKVKTTQDELSGTKGPGRTKQKKMMEAKKKEMHKNAFDVT